MPDRSALLAAKLRTLAGAPEGAARADFPGGAALIAGQAGWVLLEDGPLKGFGGALVWADRAGVSDLQLLVPAPEAPVVARRASCFEPRPDVRAVDGTSTSPVSAAPPAVAADAPSAPELAELLVDADLEVFVEDGIVRGEVLGLEVARIVHDTSTAGTPLEAPLLEVGVGHADREMTAVIHAGLTPVDQLARVVEIVRAHRRPGAERHPLNQLAPERWMRALLVADPSPVGLLDLRPADPAVPRPNLRDRAVAIGLGHDAGGAVVVACSVGVDLDLVPAAADARLMHAPDARLVLVVPERDDHAVTRALAARLRQPAEIVTVPDDWVAALARP